MGYEVATPPHSVTSFTVLSLEATASYTEHDMTVSICLHSMSHGHSSGGT